VLVEQTLDSVKVSFPLEQYGPLGKPGQVTYDQGGASNSDVTSRYSYSPSGLLYDELTSTNSAVLSKLSYSYDELNNIAEIQDALSPQKSQTFAYESNRLVSVSIANIVTNTCQYDSSGNIVNKDGGNYSYNAHFPLKVQKGGVDVCSATQDKCGRTSSRATIAGTLDFSYDKRGNLSTISSQGNNIRTITSDHKGRRVREEREDGTVTLFVSKSYKVERDSSGESISCYLIDDRGISASIITKQGKNSTEYYHRDHKGSVTFVFDQTGNITNTISYDIYGLPNVTSQDESPKYEQRTWDDGTSLYYFGARYYDPFLGRFITPDTSLGAPHMQPDALNRFAFNLNNPVNSFDPTGHFSWKDGVIMGAILLA
ncbi:MAG: RHS repeat-associated core domain-containing protein, partial [Pedobacter sp.]